MSFHLTQVGNRFINLGAVVDATFNPNSPIGDSGDRQLEVILGFGCGYRIRFYAAEAEDVWQQLTQLMFDRITEKGDN